MKTLIIGGTSLVAKALKPVVAEFSEVITAGRTGCDVKLDLNDEIDKFGFPSGVQTVVHTAAAFGGKDATEMLSTVSTNVLGTLKICQAAKRAGASHLIIISSIYATLAPSSPFYSVYSLSKKQSEEVAQLFCTANKLPLTILRPTQLFGDSDDFRKHQPFLYSIIDKAQQSEEILLNGKVDAKRNFLHIEDLAQIIAKSAKQKVIGTYACLHPQNVSFSQIARSAIEAFKSTSTIRELRDKPDVPDNIFQIDSTLYEKINYHPLITIEEGMIRIAKNRGVCT